MPVLLLGTFPYSGGVLWLRISSVLLQKKTFSIQSSLSEAVPSGLDILSPAVTETPQRKGPMRGTDSGKGSPPWGGVPERRGLL